MKDNKQDTTSATESRPHTDKNLYFYCKFHDTLYRVSDGCPFCNIHGYTNAKYDNNPLVKR